MIIKALKLKSFRNISECSLKFDESMNLIYGNNAQGKTNLIEALQTAGGQKSFRQAHDRQLIQNGCSAALLQAFVFDGQRENEIYYKISEKKKEIKVNSVPKKSAVLLNSYLKTVVFSPGDLEIASGSPAFRRKFLDAALSQLNYRYSGYLKDYERILEQRNTIIKNGGAYSLLDVFDTQLAKLGTIITIYRIEYMKKLEKFACGEYSGFAKNSEKLCLRYHSSAFSEPYSVLEYSDENIDIYYNALKNSLEKDKKLKFTSSGVHRDDILIEINGMNIKDYGSQGQKRTAALSMRLSQAKLIEDITSEKPVILLDDVLSELDRDRQDYLINNINGYQVFITCCDPANVSLLKNGFVFEVINGAVKKV